MNLAQSAIVIRRRSILETLDLAFRFVFSVCPKLLGRLMALVLLPCLGVLVLMRYVFGWHWLWVWLLALALSSIVQGIFTLCAGTAMFSSEFTVRTVLTAFVRRAPPFLFALGVSRLLIVLSAALLVPLPWVAARFAYVHEAALLEGVGWQSLARSARMVQHLGQLSLQAQVARLGLLVAVVVSCEYLGDALLAFVLQLGQPLGSLWEEGGSVFSVLGLLLSAPLVATARFLAYIDNRTRRDGWDVQVHFMAAVAQEESRLP